LVPAELGKEELCTTIPKHYKFTNPNIPKSHPPMTLVPFKGASKMFAIFKDTVPQTTLPKIWGHKSIKAQRKE
jgi:hypothetical protein